MDYTTVTQPQPVGPYDVEILKLKNGFLVWPMRFMDYVRDIYAFMSEFKAHENTKKCLEEFLKTDCASTPRKTRLENALRCLLAADVTAFQLRVVICHLEMYKLYHDMQDDEEKAKITLEHYAVNHPEYASIKAPM